MSIHGEEYLLYKCVRRSTSAFLRGTTADTHGNITMEREALTLEALAIAMAAHNYGGVVIVQVERIADAGACIRGTVKIPGMLVDCVVVAESPNTTARPS